MKLFPILISLILISQNALASQRLVADYGIPLGSEIGLEVAKDLFEPVKKVAMDGICSAGPQWYLCWYLSNMLDLQRFNLQSGLSKHLQEAVTSRSQHLYNKVFAKAQPQQIGQLSNALESWRGATLKAVSVEAFKARNTLGQLKAVIDALFALASEEIARRASPVAIENAARLVAYAVYVIGALHPEYEGNEPELLVSQKAFLIQMVKANIDPLAFAASVKMFLYGYFAQWAEHEPSARAKFDRMLWTWTQGADEGMEPLKSGLLAHQDGNADDSAAVKKMALLGLLVPPLFSGFKPHSAAQLDFVVRTTLNSFAQNIGDATTRAIALDMAAHLRKSVQQLGSQQSEQSDVSYSVLRRRQLAASRVWSELGLVMRANMIRYLGNLVPALAQVSRLLSQGKTREAAASLAGLMCYVRQYNPEYKEDDPMMRAAAFAIFDDIDVFVSTGSCPWPNSSTLVPSPLQDFQGELLHQLWLADKNFEKDVSVKQYYEQSIASLEDNMRSEPSSKSEAKIPKVSVMMSWALEVSNGFMKRQVLPLLFRKFLPDQGQKFALEEWARVGDVAVRGASEPAKNEIQQYLSAVVSTKNNTQIEAQLTSRVSELHGRLGGVDGQVARAIFERLLPILFHAFNEARETRAANNLDASARLIAYALIFTTLLYPEGEINDPIISTQAKMWFSQFFDDRDDLFLNALAARLPQDGDDILLCRLAQKAEAWGLGRIHSMSERCAKEAPGIWQSGVCFAKSATYYASMGTALALPGLVAAYVPRTVQLNSAPNAVNRMLTYAWRASLGLVVTSIFNGITKGLLDKANSIAQRWSQYPFISARIDEDENWGRAQQHFSARQWALPQYFSPAAQEGRKELFVTLQSVIQNFISVKKALAMGQTEFAASQLASAVFYLQQFHHESKTQHAPFVADAAHAFLGQTEACNALISEVLKALSQIDARFAVNQFDYKSTLKSWLCRN